MTSLPSTLTAKQIHEYKLFDEQDILQFSQEYPKITNM